MKALPLFLILLLLGCQKSGNAPYSYIANGEAPISFEVSRISDASMGPDANIWIMASVAPEDLKGIIMNGGYRESQEHENLSGMNPPDWWITRDLEEKYKYFEKRKFHDKHTDILQELKVLWVNEASGMLYFSYSTF